MLVCLIIVSAYVGIEKIAKSHNIADEL